ncbi:MAG: adenylyltransferase/cytidyltransferase family protein [bacterium]|nr:adenylyltransferase/cytidyltransferase family protein [bacterium]
MKNKKEKIVLISGGFDPIHIGHIRYINEAKKLGDKLVVALNNDHWLRLKKGREFMSAKERKEILESLASVDRVIITSHKKGTKDISVCSEIKKIKPHIFANGGDRFADNIPEFILCKKMDVKMVFNVGRGGKIRSSSEMLKAYIKPIKYKNKK